MIVTNERTATYYSDVANEREQRAAAEGRECHATQERITMSSSPGIRPVGSGDASRESSVVSLAGTPSQLVA